MGIYLIHGITYHTGVGNEGFAETFRLAFYCPFLEFAGFSTRVLTDLGSDFDLGFEPDQEAWLSALEARPLATLIRAKSRHFALRFFAVWGIGNRGDIHSPTLKELELSKPKFYDMKHM